MSFHKYAKDAALAALAAHKQGKFWAYHDLLFEKQSELKQGRPMLERLAQKLGLHMPQFRADMDSDAVKQAVDNDLAEGARLGVGGTPTFFVNGRKVEAGSSLKALQKEINKELLRLGFKKSDLPKGPSITLKGSPVKGAKGAPVVLAEFSDFQ